MTDEKKPGMTEEKSIEIKKNTDAVLLSGDEQAELKIKDKEKKKSLLEQDPEMLYTTDPQEDMVSPITSIMQNIKEGGKVSDVISKEEATKRKDKNT